MGMNETMTNEQVIADYLNEGCTEKREFRIGLELEHFVLRRDKRNASYEEITGIVRKLVEDGVPSYDEEGRVDGFYNEYYSVELEAASQLKISIFPQDRLKDMEQIYQDFVHKFYCLTQKDGYTLETYGYQPVAKAETLKLVPKKQFEYMNAYFKESGSTGMNMMRGTAATQVSIDYEDETDYVRKYRLAYILTPVFALLTDNSPVYEGKPYLKHLLRAHIWKHIDPSRCNIPEGIFSENFGFDRYAEYIYTREPILITEGGETTIVFRQTANDFYAGKELKKTQAEHLLSMVLPDVRTKQYIEICSADSMPAEYAIGFAAIIKGIFYSEEAMEQLETNFVVLEEQEIEEAKDKLIRSGYHTSIYGMPAAKAVGLVLEAAKRGLPVKEEKYLEPFEQLWKEEHTLAEMVRESRKIS